MSLGALRKYRQSEHGKAHERAYGRMYARSEKGKAVRKAWNLNNREKRRNMSRKGQLKKRYGITLEEFEKLEQQQDGSCAICRKLPYGKDKRLHVDHCHQKNFVRGLLCWRCNFYIGGFFDNPEFLRSAAAYLESPPAKGKENEIREISSKKESENPFLRKLFEGKRSCAA